MLIEALYHEAYAHSGRIDNFIYRARNPTLVGRRQHIRGAINVSTGDNSKTDLKGSDGGTEKATATLWTEDDDGVVGMTGSVDLLDPSLCKFPPT